jgi:hypothetical protein
VRIALLVRIGVLVRILGNRVDLVDLVDLADPVGLVDLEEPWPSVAQLMHSTVGRESDPCRTLSHHGR